MKRWIVLLCCAVLALVPAAFADEAGAEATKAPEAEMTEAPETETSEAEEPETEASWFDRAFEEFGDVTPVTWITLGALVLLGVLLAVASGKSVKWSSDMLARGALTLAIAYVLSCIRLFPMPLGGSVTAASMLPLILFAYAYGFAPGLLAGLAYGLLQFVQKPPTLTTLAGMVLDYPIAFMLIALAAFARYIHGNDVVRVLLAVVFGCAGRLLAHFLSGFLFYAEYAPAGWNPVWYSFVYNIAYMGPEMIITGVILALPAVRRAMERVYGIRPERTDRH